MRHLKSGRKLNVTASHRKAMLSNMAVSILDYERITTTTAKAKEVRSVVERLITYGKKGTLHAIRLAARKIKDKTILKKLFEDIAPSYKDREGGYTRIIKFKNRKGDNAELAIVELVGRKKKEKPVQKTAKSVPAEKSKPVSSSEGEGQNELKNGIESRSAENAKESAESKPVKSRKKAVTPKTKTDDDSAVSGSKGKKEKTAKSTAKGSAKSTGE